MITLWGLCWQHILFTGELNSLTRKQAQQLASSLSVLPLSNVSKQAGSNELGLMLMALNLTKTAKFKQLNYFFKTEKKSEQRNNTEFSKNELRPSSRQENK